MTGIHREMTSQLNRASQYLNVAYQPISLWHQLINGVKYRLPILRRLAGCRLRGWYNKAQLGNGRGVSMAWLF